MRKNFPTVARWRSKYFVFALRLAFRFVSFGFAVLLSPVKKQLVVIAYLQVSTA